MSAPLSKRSAFHLSHIFNSPSVPPQPSPLPPLTSQLLRLPDDVLFRIIMRLSPIDHAALSDAHPYLARFLLPIVPALHLRLFPHQLSALHRMQQMERPSTLPMPLLKSIFVAPDLVVVVDLATGALYSLRELPKVSSPIGGLLCDEPGLGKTITALSLILKTRGRFPLARPHNVRKTSLCSPREGKTVNRPPMHSYNEPGAVRFRMLGDPEHNTTRETRLVPRMRRYSERRVRLPNFFQATKGQGSLPTLGGGANIILSGATLIIVPAVLLQHWLAQIDMHVTLGTLRVLCVESSGDLPMTALDLAQNYDVIIVAFELVSDLYMQLRESVPVLLRVHFLRVIVDEGHKLSSTRINNLTSVCSRIRADARWIITGTPSPTTLRSDIDHFHILLAFIRDESFGLDREAWKEGIVDPYSAYEMSSLGYLGPLLERVMIRSDKSIITQKVHISNILLEFSEDTAASYNGLVRMTRRNLITSDWYSEAHKESLLNKRNNSMAQVTIANLRKACCFGGSMHVEFTPKEVIETLEDIYNKYRSIAGIDKNDRFLDPTLEMSLMQADVCNGDKGLQEENNDLACRTALYTSLLEQDKPLLRLTKEIKEKGRMARFEKWTFTGKLHTIGEALLSRHYKCDKCEEGTSFPMVTPCGHLLCDGCVVLDKTKCVASGCGALYRHDDKGIPEDLIELQPSIYSEKWVENWEYTESTKMDYLMKRIKELPLNEVWVDGETTPRMVAPKVIVHSEYGDHLKLVALHMNQSDKLRNAYVEMVVNMKNYEKISGRFMRATKYAMECVKTFCSNDSVNVLLMNTRSGGVGLDLSFVEYIFLLEPLWDAATELQIVSRAHRIGCKKDIIVERLIMRDSLEEDMLNDLEKGREGAGVACSKVEKDHLKKKMIFQNLKIVNSNGSGGALITNDNVPLTWDDEVVDETQRGCLKRLIDIHSEEESEEPWTRRRRRRVRFGDVDVEETQAG